MQVWQRLHLHEGMEIDYAHLLEHLRKEMPVYAIPCFYAAQQQMETTGTFKYQKNNLKKDGFDINAAQVNHYSFGCPAQLAISH